MVVNSGQHAKEITRKTHAAAARSNLDTAITLRSAETEMQNTKELAQERQKLQLQNRISTPKQKKRFGSNF